MKMKISSKDMKLLVVALSALIVVLMFRLAIFPAMDAYEAGKIEYEEKKRPGGGEYNGFSMRNRPMKLKLLKDWADWMKCRMIVMK